MWRILHLDLLAGQRSGLIKLEVTRRHILGDDLERRMSVADNPFTILYVVLHELCVAIVMDTVIRQVRALLHGRWKDAIRFGTTHTRLKRVSKTNSMEKRIIAITTTRWRDCSSSCSETLVLDPAHIPHVNAAGGSAWLPYCVSVRLRYTFGENPSVTFLGIEGNHGGRACWQRFNDWEKCRQRVSRAVEVNGSSAAGELTQVGCR